MFCRPVPAGIDHIQAAGYVGMGGGQGWLRFEATPQAPAILTRGRDWQRVPREEMVEFIELPWLAHYDRQASWRMRWQEMSRIRSPECVKYEPLGDGWAISLVVDTRRRVVFAYFWAN